MCFVLAEYAPHLATVLGLSVGVIGFFLWTEYQKASEKANHKPNTIDDQYSIPSE